MKRTRWAWVVVLLATGAATGAAREEEYPKRAPFTAVRWDGDRPVVQVDGKWWICAAIDGREVADTLAFAREKHGERWRKRFAEDLVQVLTEMGHPPGPTVDLTVEEPDGGKRSVLEKVAMTEANRRLVWEAVAAERATPAVSRVKRAHRDGVAPEWGWLVRKILAGDREVLPTERVAEDLDQLEWILENRWSYLGRVEADWRGALDSIRAAAAGGLPRGALAVMLAKALALLGDGHTRVAESPDRLLPPGYLPFLVEPVGERLVAFREDRTGFLDPERPFLVALDGVEVARWLEASRSLTARASPAFVRRHSTHLLRYLSWLRQELDLPDRETVVVRLADAAGDSAEITLPRASEKPTYGDHPRGGSRMLDGGIGYLRIPRMEDDPEFVRGTLDSLENLTKGKGIVIDVRGNGGGSRVLLRSVLARFLDLPRVTNAAAYRLAPGEPASVRGGYLADRFLWPEGGSWSPAARESIAAFRGAFEPEWSPGPGAFSEWHYMVVEPAEGRRIRLPVAILEDEGCFSATDVFLAAFRGVAGVTLVGTPSGGGSGRARGEELAHSRIAVQVSSMASFRPDGRLFDGRSVEPDRLAEPSPGFWIGREDPALVEALRVLGVE